DRAEKLELAELNLRAGHQAKRSAAFEAAFNYCKLGTSLLDQTSWDENYDLTLTLYNQAIITAYSCSAFENIDPFADEVIEHARKLEDETDAAKIEQSSELKEILVSLLDKLQRYAEVQIESLAKSDLAAVVSHKTGVPMGKVQTQERERLLNIEEHLQKRVVGQDHAINSIA
ncbi:MAG: hypothetical protein KGD60_16200, partial [Candidatus Thorarchaeota archaeon]|nr:hypothetical protein [Candidatus Thorarchaeota archaeon]